MSYKYEKNPKKITNFLLFLLVLSMVVSLVSVIFDYILLDLLNGPIARLQEQADAFDRRQQMFGILYLLVFVITGITFLTWINRANKNCRNFGAKNMKFTSGWSIGYYFVPFLNLYKPYQAMKEIWKISKNPQNWENEKGSWLLVTWWWLWLVNGFISYATFKQTMKSETLKAIKFSTELDIVSEVIYFSLCIVSILMINSLINRQEKLLDSAKAIEDSINHENNNINFNYSQDANKNFNEDFNHEQNIKHIAKTIEKKNETEIAVPKNDLNSFYEQALLEYENNTMVKATYSKSIVESDGDAKKGKALYIQMRVADLSEDFKKTIVKEVVKNAKGGILHTENEGSNDLIYNNFSTSEKSQRTLSVDTKPSGISILINGKHVSGVTPLTANTNIQELTVDYVYKNVIIATKVYDTTKTGLSVFENFSEILHKDYNVEPGLRRCLKCLKEFKDFDDKCPICGTAKLTVPI